MTVIVKNYLDDQCRYQLFAKGSPEKIKELSIKSSLPADFDSILNEYAERGYRVLALAHREAPKGMSSQELLTMPREDAEKNFTFLGFLVMHNKLKSVTVKEISKLNEAGIRTIMATGDNMLTAISVGRKCGIVEDTQVVYLGDIQDQGNGRESISWKIAKEAEISVDEKPLHHIHHDGSGSNAN